MSDSRPDAIVLAGGRGTRIATLFPDLPKPLIPAAGQPFLYWISRWLVGAGVGSLTFSVGYQATQVKTWAAAQGEGLGVPVRCVREAIPLGTGGAVRLCLPDTGPDILVCNGDSLILTDLTPAIAYFRASALDGMIVGVPMPDTSRYGTLDVLASGRLRGFEEKRLASAAGLINGGVYLFRRHLFDSLQEGVAMSLERDVLPSLLRDGAAIGVWSAGHQPFLDIGTPESVAQATAFIQRGRAFFEALAPVKAASV